MNIRVGLLSANYDEWDGSFVYLNARTRFPVTELSFSYALRTSLRRSPLSRSTDYAT
jgi:hypothetical protein